MQPLSPLPVPLLSYSQRAAIAAVVSEFGSLDLLVNNAAVFASAALESLTLEQWDAVFETNARDGAVRYISLTHELVHRLTAAVSFEEASRATVEACQNMIGPTCATVASIGARSSR